MARREENITPNELSIGYMYLPYRTYTVESDMSVVQVGTVAFIGSYLTLPYLTLLLL